MANFLGKQPSEEQLTQLTNRLRLDSFKLNDSVNHEKYKGIGVFEDNGNFIRKGVIYYFSFEKLYNSFLFLFFQFVNYR